MSQANDKEGRERRLELYHERIAASIWRRDAARKTIADARALVSDPARPSTAIEFRVPDGFVPGRWGSAAGVGTAFENYVTSLQDFERVRFGCSAVLGVTDEHRRALDAVVAAAAALEKLGWPVNWEQNIQAILDVSEFGLLGGSLVDRFGELPDEICLRDRLTLLGSLTFRRQSRTSDGTESAWRSVVLTSANAATYAGVVVRLVKREDNTQCQYRSDWLPAAIGKQVRVAI